ncbi:MAG: DUF411 domain-containing protein [Candidatus Hodarchaeales archaeon]
MKNSDLGDPVSQFPKVLFGVAIGVVLISFLLISGTMILSNWSQFPNQDENNFPKDNGIPGENNISDKLKLPEGLNITFTIYSSSTCGCCHQYVDYLESLNSTVNHTKINDINYIKNKFKIPQDLRTCHTSIIENYTVEGHVPIEAIYKLINETPSEIDGIALPGMPNGSPGMGGVKTAPFEIIAFKDNESKGIFVSI